MIQFFTPELTDRDLVDSYFLPSGYRCCEYAFTNIFAWRDAFHEEITAYAGYLTVRCAGPRYFWPAGKGDIRPMLQALELDAKAQGKPLSFYSLTEEEKDRLEQLYPGKFTFTLARDGFDYCYDIDRLADLTGKKLHAKRNHIHRFEEHYPDWTVEEISAENLPECIRLNQDWEDAAAAAGHDDFVTAQFHAGTVLSQSLWCVRRMMSSCIDSSSSVNVPEKPLTRTRRWPYCSGCSRAASSSSRET